MIIPDPDPQGQIWIRINNQSVSNSRAAYSTSWMGVVTTWWACSRRRRPGPGSGFDYSGSRVRKGKKFRIHNIASYPRAAYSTSWMGVVTTWWACSRRRRPGSGSGMIIPDPDPQGQIWIRINNQSVCNPRASYSTSWMVVVTTWWACSRRRRPGSGSGMIIPDPDP